MGGGIEQVDSNSRGKCRGGWWAGHWLAATALLLAAVVAVGFAPTAKPAVASSPCASAAEIPIVPKTANSREAEAIVLLRFFICVPFVEHPCRPQYRRPSVANIHIFIGYAAATSLLGVFEAAHAVFQALVDHFVAQADHEMVLIRRRTAHTIRIESIGFRLTPAAHRLNRRRMRQIEV